MEYVFTTENFEAEVLKAELPVLVDFYADWCGPCKMMAPIVAQMAEKFEGKLKVGKCNVDDNMQLAETYRITNIPCFMIFKNSEAVATLIGAKPAAQFAAEIEEALK